MATEKNAADLVVDSHGNDVDDHYNDPKRINSMVINRARAATSKEQQMTLMEGIRTYPKAISWSLLISLCIAMEGFDLCLLNTFCKSSSAPDRDQLAVVIPFIDFSSGPLFDRA
jgi:hypothetical protein